MPKRSHVKKSIQELIDLYIVKESGVFGEDNNFPTECWEWRGALDTDGYGQLTFRHIHHKAHRFFFEHWTGTRLRDEHIDHLCRNRCCVNPQHLEPVSSQENLRRGVRHNKTHCSKGHAFDAANTYVTKSGFRQCRQCKKENQRRYMEKKKCR